MEIRFTIEVEIKVLIIRTEFIKHNFMKNVHTYFITGPVLGTKTARFTGLKDL